MKSRKRLNDIAEIISYTPYLPERIRLADNIGIVLAEEHKGFNWNQWYQACKIQGEV